MIVKELSSLGGGLRSPSAPFEKGKELNCIWMSSMFGTLDNDIT